MYRLLGVHLFGAVIPTGGIAIRRLTGARMAPYTLERSTLRSARAFYYRTCVFESLHLPFLVALLGITIARGAAGQLGLAAQDMAVNLAFNVFPIMHHRRTRTRIVALLLRAGLRPAGAAVSPGRGGRVAV